MARGRTSGVEPNDGGLLAAPTQRRRADGADSSGWTDPAGDAVPVFRIGRSVGIGGVNAPADVVAAKRALGWAGDYPRDRADQPTVEATLEGDPQFLHGIRQFQITSGLKTDAFMRPNGETESALDRRIAPLVRAHGPVRAAEDRKTAPALTPVGDRGAGWGNPTVWAFEQAGETIGGALGVGETTQVGGRAEAPDDEPADDAARSDPWQRVPAPPFFSHGTWTFEANGPIRITRHNGASLGFDGIEYYVEWVPLDADGREGSVAGERFAQVPRGGHIMPLSSHDEELEPPYENPHGWRVRVRIAPRPAVNGTSQGAWLSFATARGEDDGSR